MTRRHGARPSSRMLPAPRERPSRSQFPEEIGGFAGAWAVAAAGGALITAVGMTVLGGAVGAAGYAAAYAVARHHAVDVESQLVAGGLVLWVATPDDAAEQRALDVLRRCGGALVHSHTIDREWGVANAPLHDVQPDPFLEHDEP